MLKNLLKSKKFMAVVAIVTTVALGTGGTFAWLYARAPLGLNSEVGTTSFTAELDFPLSSPIEPGWAAERDLAFANTGSTDIMIKLSFVKPSVTIRSWVETDPDYPGLEFWGGWLDPADYIVIANDPNLTVAPRADEWEVCDISPSGDSAYDYLQDSDGNWYLLILGNELQPALPFSIELDGPGAGNVYQGALINFGNSVFGVGEWWNDDCLQEFFGIEWADLEFVSDLPAVPGVFKAGPSKRAIVQAKIEAARAERN